MLFTHTTCLSRTFIQRISPQSCRHAVSQRYGFIIFIFQRNIVSHKLFDCRHLIRSNPLAVHIFPSLHETPIQGKTKSLPRKIASAQETEILHAFCRIRAMLQGRYQRSDKHHGHTVRLPGYHQTHLAMGILLRHLPSVLIITHNGCHLGIRTYGHLHQTHQAIGVLQSLAPFRHQFRSFTLYAFSFWLLR